MTKGGQLYFTNYIPTKNDYPRVKRIFDYFQRRLTTFCEKHEIKDGSETQKLLVDLVSYYNDQRILEETREIPTKRWQQAIDQDKGD